MHDFRFDRSCVNWPTADVDAAGGLRDLIDERQQITRRTFLAHVDTAERWTIEHDLGYAVHPSNGLTMAGDTHVEYFRSRWHGRRVYGFVHSAIEYVFVRRAA